jgi:aryl sulfotransferase
MSRTRVHYVSDDDDSARWDAFRFRDGDIVVSTRSKSGTTWVQMICALLVLGTPDLPAPLTDLSPWVDHCVEPVEDVVARLAAQPHRRFVKTHTPLDGIPLDPRATYVVVGREPLDLAVSLYHQGDNLDRQRIAELTGRPAPPPRERPPLHDWLVEWTLADRTPLEQPDSLVGVVHHVADAWHRAGSEGPAVVLVHYDDLHADLDAQMRRLADALGIQVRPDAWRQLVEAATFERMRSRASALSPDTRGVLKDSSRFFRRGRPGAGREVLTHTELAAYEARLATLAAPEVLAWLHR